MVAFTWMMSSGRPWPVSFVHVSPPSVERKKPPSVPDHAPFSHGPSCRCHMPQYTMFGFCGSICTSLAPVWSLTNSTLLEGLAAVGRAVEAALLIGSVRMASNGNKDAVRILRIDGQAADLLAVVKAHVRPCLACVRSTCRRRPRWIDQAAPGLHHYPRRRRSDRSRPPQLRRWNRSSVHPTGFARWRPHRSSSTRRHSPRRSRTWRAGLAHPPAHVYDRHATGPISRHFISE